MKKIMLAALLMLVIIGAGAYFLYYLPMEKAIQEAISLPIENIDFSSLKDGVYQGSYTDYGVEVVIKGQKIQDIRMTKNRDAHYARKAEAVIGHVLEKQSLQVDLVSGATSTSKAILRAVEDALLAASGK